MRLALVGSISVASVGCNDILNAYDPSTVSTDYYDTAQGQEMLVIDMYSRCREIYSEYVLQYFGTDMYLACDESTESKAFNGYSTELDGLAGTDDYWEILYTLIQEANILENRCTVEIAGSEYESLTAQARFLRAMGYYYLVETFGSVPLLIEENTSASNIIESVTCAPEEDIYAYIIGELEAIDGMLPDAAAENGRVSDTAVRFLLGKAYLTRAYRDYAVSSDVDNAIAMFESITSSSSYSLLDSFTSVFDEDNQANKEVIWAIQYGSDKNYLGSGNSIHAQFGFNITSLYPGMYALDQSDYSSMQRYIWTNPIVHEWFRNPQGDARYEATFRFDFVVNDSSHANYGQVGVAMPIWNDDSGNTQNAEFFYPFKTDDGDYNWYPSLGIMGWSTDCMPMCRKFLETKIDWGGAGTREDVVMRVAEAYFLCAEAYLLKGDKQSAADNVNVIISRAALTDTDYELMKVAADDVTIDRLLEEKGCEMFGEHDRWFDLKRTETLLTRARLNPLVAYYDNLSETHLVRPIPYSETIKLDGLNQNDGYNN